MAILKPIYSITPFTMLDYPGHTACIIWFAGCNMRCGYCHNPDIVLGKGKISVEETVSFFMSRRALLEGVVFSGGECTLHPFLLNLAQAARSLGYRIKIDTNGSRPDRLKKLLDLELVDYIALDFKATRDKYQEITHANTWSAFVESLNLIRHADVAFEVRTTWHQDLLSPNDLVTMVHFLETNGYRGNYYIQHFVNGVPTLGRLNESWGRLKADNLSTSHIQVVLR
ncbi:anaerobic ribonucleoside-triphosphate reductase activating protein [Sphingobacterium psychroaquaticum]|uniref:Pyruvate formate lyase activating enzyme n=1 Tax=Sphingobacterium psychroaquaticum TaxID=561061 RepID=A0A1X7INL0_9SPHI|nr:anaerobic ribonucleoside-triphosphate reductase activating protein [Sphingobacterium psychroaquaticum]SMG16257.1 pyruvate formate lyase activating enzyme [Sphingobacterium psychroaquaticum]